MLFATLASELMTECNDGKVLIDLFNLISEKGFTSILTMTLNTIENLPMVLAFTILGLVGTIIPGLQYWGGFGFGEATRRIIG